MTTTTLSLLAAALAVGLVVAVAMPARPRPRPRPRMSPPPAPPWGDGSRAPPTWMRSVPVVALTAGVVVLLFGPVAGASLVGAAMAAPRLRDRRAARRRVAAIEHDLPEVLDLLALAVGAGLTVPNAVAAVAAHASGPLAAELSVVAGEAGRGRRFAEALDELPRRAGECTRPLAATLAACERYGAPVADALDRLAAEARDRHRRVAEQAARRLPVLLLFPLVLCILPAFALLAVAPLIADAVMALRA